MDGKRRTLMDRCDCERIFRSALMKIAGVSANENSEPDQMADALGEIQGIVRRAFEEANGKT